MATITSILISLLAAAGVTVDLGGLKSTTPSSWQEAPVANRMRIKQFVVPGKDGEAELAIFFFGEGQGGSIDANLERWKKQFQSPSGESADSTAKTSTVKLASGGKATVLDIHGTYMFKARPMDPGPGEPRPNHRMLAAVLESPKGNYFIRLVGPAKIVEHGKKEFDTWLKAFK
jgi:hypothetical protein